MPLRHPIVSSVKPFKRCTRCRKQQSKTPLCRLFSSIRALKKDIWSNLDTCITHEFNVGLELVCEVVDTLDGVALPGRIVEHL